MPEPSPRPRRAAAADATTADAGPKPATGPGRLWQALAHPGRGQVIAAVILFVVGVGGATQIKLTSADDAYTNARREDLIQILDGLGVAGAGEGLGHVGGSRLRDVGERGAADRRRHGVCLAGRADDPAR